MEEVASEIDRTLSGVEGIEDAPAMRWMRGLREALGSLHSPRTSYEDIESAKWVREHCGLDEVKRHYFSACALSGDLAEWKREVYELCEYIGVSHEDCDGEAEMLQEAYKVLGKRLIPEGREWPRFEDGKPVSIGDEIQHNDEVCTVESVRFYDDSYTLYGISKSGKFTVGHISWWNGERVKRPAPKVPDADGAEIRAGETLFHVRNGDSVVARQIMPPDKFEDTDFVQHFSSEYTHKRPVIAADGKPLRVGETVWVANDPTGRKHKVVRIENGFIKAEADNGWVESPEGAYFTHERPDSKEQLERDIRSFAEDNSAIPHDVDQMERDVADLVRRGMALAAKERDA